jgi:uncharacterized cofD-like protein
VNHQSSPHYGPDPASARFVSATLTTPTFDRVPRLVAMGGGTGLPVVLSGLADHIEYGHGATTTLSEHLTAIVTVTDDGGSSGWVRREMGTLPPGDIRNCLAALATRRSPLTSLLQHRFSDAGWPSPTAAGHANPLTGQSVGNLALAALTQMTGDFAAAVDQLAALLETRGRVLPSTLENVTLIAELDNGEVVAGETAIVQRNRSIRQVSLARAARPLPETLRALVNADGIVLGPGSLYTSLLPNLLIGGIAATMSGVNAVRIYVANLMTQPGETDGYTLGDHLRAIHQHVGTSLFDYVLVNRRRLSARAEGVQRRLGAEQIDPALGDCAGSFEIVEGDFLREFPDGSVRHDADALGAAIVSAVRRGRRPMEAAPSIRQTKVSSHGA